jgi:ribokinase
MITVVGSLRLDHEVPVPQHPAAGELVPGGHVLRRLGGRGAIQAVAAARHGAPQGLRVAMVGRVGQDLDGSRLRSELRAEGIDTGWVLPTPEAPTGQALVAVRESDGDRTGVVSSGANAHLTPEDCAAAGAVLRDATVTLLQQEVAEETVAAAARLAGGSVLLKPSRAVPLHEDVLHMVDILVPNREELAALVGEDLPDLHAVADAARALRGPRAVVVTLGAEGAVLSEDGAVLFVPPARVAAVDRAAAGDAFCGALACGVAEGEPLHEAVRLACAAAGVAVSRRGAASALPRRAETERFLKTGELDNGE